jgi:hypothetical protein
MNWANDTEEVRVVAYGREGNGIEEFIGRRLRQGVHVFGSDGESLVEGVVIRPDETTKIRWGDINFVCAVVRLGYSQ